jgi:hypothetical protein
VRSGKQKGKRINRVEAEVGQHKKQHTAHHHTRSYNTATQQHSTTQHNTTLYNTTLQNINISAHLTSSYSTTQQRIQYHRPLQLHRNRFRCGGGEYSVPTLGCDSSLSSPSSSSQLSQSVDCHTSTSSPHPPLTSTSTSTCTPQALRRSGTNACTLPNFQAPKAPKAWTLSPPPLINPSVPRRLGIWYPKDKRPTQKRSTDL